VFVRDATGLVRELSWVDGMILNVAYFSLGGTTLIIFGLGSYLFPGSDMGITLGVFGLLLNIPLVIAYSMFAASMPRSGGDYVYISRALSPGIGFATSWVFFIFAWMWMYGTGANFLAPTIIGPSLAAMGSLAGSAELSSLAQVIIQPSSLVIIGLAINTTAFVVIVLTPSTLHRVLAVLFVIGILGYPILYTLPLALSSNSQFVAAFNSYTAQAHLNTSYSALIRDAQMAGAQLAPPTLAASFAAIPMVYATLAFPQSSTYVGGEMKRATRQVPFSLVMGLVVTCVAMGLMSYVTYSVFGYDFVSATAFYGFSGASGYPLPAAPYTSYFLAILYPNPVYNWFMIVSGIAWQVLLAVMGMVAGTRFLFAASFDRMLPASIADVNERFHSPVKAAIIVWLVGDAYAIITPNIFVGAYVNSVTAWTSGYIVVMVAAILFPFLKRDLFERSPPFVRKRLAGLPLMSLFGGLGAVALLVVFYFLLLNPSVSGATSVGIAIVILSYGVGLAAYYGIKAYRKREGLNIDFIFSQIPPE
jgi:amino acid transporter